MKTQDVVTALQANQKFLVNSPLVTFQNGVQSDELAARILPRQNISSVVVNISASYLTPGTVTVIYPGWLVVGRPFGKPDAQLESLAVILRQVARTAISTNILGVHWLKLIFNLNNAFPALLNTSLHQAYAVPYIRQLAARVMREGLQIAQRAKIRLDSLPEASVTLFRILGVLPPVLAGLLMARSTRRIQTQWPLLGSTLQSLRRGRPTEIDYLNGEIVRLGAKLGMRTPLNSTIVEMVHRVEQTGQFWNLAEIQSRMREALR